MNADRITSDAPPPPARRVIPAPVHAADAGAAAAPAAAPSSSMAMLIASHILRDGELVLLILKPSLLFVVMTCRRFIAIVLILTIAGRLFDEQLPGSSRVYLEAGIFLIVGRLMWAVLQWMGRLYVLTDLRIVRLSGVFSVDVFDCPLRKIARTRVVYTNRIERILNIGSIEIIPADDEHPIDQWQLVSRPVEVHEQIVATINRAKHTGS